MTQKSLLILSENSKNVLLSARNLKKAKVTTTDSINTYDLLNANQVVFTEQALIDLSKKLA